MGIFAEVKKITAQELRMNLSKILKSCKSYLITDQGKPVKAMIPFGSFLDLLEIFEELNDKALVQEIAQGRKEYQRGRKWIPVNRLFHKIRNK